MNLNQEVKSVVVAFENLESIVIPAEIVDELYFDELKPFMHYQKCINFNLRENMMYRCSYLRLSINYKDKSDLEYNSNDYEQPLGMFTNNPTSNRVVDRPNILGRLLEHNDIAAIHFLNEDDESILELYVPYDGEMSNESMTATINTDRKRIDIVLDGLLE